MSLLLRSKWRWLFTSLKNDLSGTSRWGRGDQEGAGAGEVLLSALGFGNRLVLLLFLPGVILPSSVIFPLQFPFCLEVSELQWQQCVPVLLVLLATSHGFSQKTGFPTGTALLISIIIDCNYLTSPYIPRGTLRETVFAKCSFYLRKILQACSGVLLI